MIHKARAALILGVLMADLHCANTQEGPATMTAAKDTYPWMPDQQNGTYRNPILLADYSDPDVIRVGDDFYMTASSFNCTPGLPILRSRDLINWTIINHALKNNVGEQYDKPLHGCGVWAPAIRHHDGKFWIFFPTPDEGIYVTTATDPAGAWTPPHLLAAGKGLIDPCPLWDDDGQAYLVHAYARSRAGTANQLRVSPMAPDGSRLLGEGRIIYQPQHHRTTEGPKFHKKDGWYYILAPAGGVAEGYQLVLRSRDVYGPYEEKVVLERGSTEVNGPHQGALIDLKNGEWWFAHFQELQPYGRIVHLQPVAWRDGWPHMGTDHDGNGIGEPVSRHRKPDVGRSYPIQLPQTSDEFDGGRLSLQWQWHANHREDSHSLTARGGWLRLPARFVEAGDFSRASNLLLQKLPAMSFVVETRIDASSLEEGEEAGLIMMGQKHAAAGIRRAPAGGEVMYRVNNELLLKAPCPSGAAIFRVAMQPGGLCSFSFSTDGSSFTNLEPAFQAVEGRWIGAKVGLFSISTTSGSAPGHADFDYFRFSPLRPPAPDP